MHGLGEEGHIPNSMAQSPVPVAMSSTLDKLVS